MRALLIGLLLLCSTTLNAHNMPISVVHIFFDEDGNFTISMRFDVDSLSSLAMPDDPELLDLYIQYSRGRLANDAEDEIETIARHILAQVRLSFDGLVVTPELVSLDIGQPTDASREQQATLRGNVAPGRTRCRWLGNPCLKTVNLQIESATVPGTYMEIVQDYSDSAVYTGVPSNRIDVASAYFVNGILHIVPLGLDHILFILGLFFVIHSRSALLWQVSSFTVAHSITLGVCSSGWIPPDWLQVSVEPLIALSIAFVGFENCFAEKMTKWRPAIVFSFGLIHGMGFAGVLGDIGLPEYFFWIALLSFNIGIEVAQLLILACAGLLLCCFMKKSWYRIGIVLPCCIAIGMSGLWMFIERAFLQA